MPPDAPETVLAYHRLRLREIREIYEEQNVDLDHYLGVEQKVSEGIDTLEVDFTEVRETLISLDVDLDADGTIQAPDKPVTPLPPKTRAKQAPSSIDFEDLVTEAGSYGSYAADTGRPLARIAEDVNRDYWMGAEEARAYGLIDSIATPPAAEAPPLEPVSDRVLVDLGAGRFAQHHGAAPEGASLDDTMITGTGGRFEIPNEGVGFNFRCMVTE
jgi:hypothetical protein